MRAAAATAVAAVTHNQINFYFYINSFLSLLLIVVCLSDQIYRRPLHTRVLQTLLFRVLMALFLRAMLHSVINPIFLSQSQWWIIYSPLLTRSAACHHAS